jgi:hypothetical protein
MKMQAAQLRGSRRLAAIASVLAVGAGVLLAGWGAGCGKDKKPIQTEPPLAPVVQVLAPDGGEIYIGGATAELTWTATDGDTPAANLRITIELSLDAGSNWSPLVSGEPNDGSFIWTVPAIATSQALIRVTATDGANVGSDTSANPFTISVTPPPPNNTYSAGDASGGRGAMVEVPLTLQNQDTVGLIETSIGFDGVVAECKGVRLTGRGAGMQLTVPVAVADTVRVVIRQQGIVVIAPGDGPIAMLSFRLTGSVGAQTNLQLTRSRLLDPSGVEHSLRTHHGSITVLVVDTPETLTADGWAAFEAGNFALAAEKFDAAIGLDAQYGPAFTGRGWVRLTLATTSAEFTAAVSGFDDAVARGQSLAEVHGGRAAALLALGGDNLAGALSAAQAALAASPDFVFAHRTSFDYRDLHLVAAFAEAGRGGRFAEARDEADRVQAQASGIRQADPQTWVVDSVRYPTFESAVLAWLQKMSAAFAG